METRTKKEGYTVIHYNPSPVEKLMNIGRAFETKKRLEAEREEKNKKPLTKAQKIKFDETVEKFRIDMEIYLNNISYK